MGKHRTWTDAELATAVAASISVREVLQRLGLVPKGGSYKLVKGHIARLQLDTAHFETKTDLLGRMRVLAKETNSYANRPELVFRRGAAISMVKRHLPNFKDASRCAECGHEARWNQKPLKLQVDHINGDSDDHRLENLRYLCPNCHSQTDTFSGRLTQEEKLKKIQQRKSS